MHACSIPSRALMQHTHTRICKRARAALAIARTHRTRRVPLVLARSLARATIAAPASRFPPRSRGRWTLHERRDSCSSRISKTTIAIASRLRRGRIALAHARYPPLPAREEDGRCTNVAIRAAVRKSKSTIAIASGRRRRRFALPFGKSTCTHARTQHMPSRTHAACMHEGIVCRSLWRPSMHSGSPSVFSIEESTLLLLRSQ